MQEFYATLSPLQKFFLFCALLGGVVFMIRIVLMVAGLGGHDIHDGSGLAHADAHSDSDSSFKLFSLHGLTGFFMMFGLVGLAMSRQFWIPDLAAAAGGIVAGLFTVWVIGKIFVTMARLQSDGTLSINSAVGQQGRVYLRIPSGGTGQVQVPCQGRLMIYDAVASGKEELKTGEPVLVIDVTGGNLLVVEKAQAI
jgi:membrane protein implicated in regulation of membrane protease activity